MAGPTGGIHLVSPSGGAPGSVRLQLSTSIFSGTDFLYTGDEVEQTVQRLSASYTPVDFLEIFASLEGKGSSIRGGDRESMSLHTMGDASSV